MYLLDANVFIEAHKRYYGLDFCPAFWSWIDKWCASRNVYSLKMVQKELTGRGDNLSGWVKARKHLFLSSGESVSRKLREVATWSHETYSSSAANRFLSGADCFLVAYASTHSCTVVTHEVKSNGREIKLPNACDQFGVNCINIFQLLRQEKARFVLGTPTD